MLKSILRVSQLAVFALFIGTPACCAQTSQPPSAASSPSQTSAFPIPTNKWTGDFDAMLKRGFMRALVTYSKTQYYVVKGTQFGASYESLKEFENFVNRNYPSRGKNIPFHVIMIPVARDQLLSRLNEGTGDVAVAGLTVMPERQKLVDFTEPMASGINEIVVTGPQSPKISAIDDLAGKEIFVRKSSSYWEHLQQINQHLQQERKTPIKFRLAPEDLEDEDLLEMLNAGTIGIVVVDDYVARLWQQLYKNIEPHPAIAVNSGGSFAWAIRKNSPHLVEVLNKFVATHRQGTAFGNALVQKYAVSGQMIRNATSSTELKKFNETVAMFQKYSRLYNMDYLLMMAQAYQESGLSQNAKSKVGAIGVMQLMPSTGVQMKVGDIHEIDSNIHAGVKYIRFMVDRYFANEPMNDVNKLLFAFAAYNAGPGRIHQLRQEAAKRGLNPNIWLNNVEMIAAAEIGTETVTYVSNIYKYYVAYKLILEQEEERKKARESSAGGKSEDDENWTATSLPFVKWKRPSGASAAPGP
jgi:membrane-bound lytic murein transglycosylase MltF